MKMPKNHTIIGVMWQVAAACCIVGLRGHGAPETDGGADEFWCQGTAVAGANSVGQVVVGPCAPPDDAG